MATPVNAAPGVVAGIRHVLHGFRLIRAPGVRTYVIVPLAINVLLFAAALAAAGNAVDDYIARSLASLPQWLAWLEWVLWLVFGLLALVVVFFAFTLVANIVASPFNGVLAEAVEHQLRPQLGALSVSWSAVVRELGRTLLAELRKLVYIALRALPLLLLSVIPGLHLLAPPLWLLFGAWMLCMEYLDCPLGNHGQVFPRVLEAMRAHRRLAFGFGLGMTVITLIPVINFVAVPVGVAAATSLYCAHLAED